MSGRTAWYPGHMAKGKRELEKLLEALDLVVEVRDARAPLLTASPLAAEFARRKKLWVALTKADLAHKPTTDAWVRHFEAGGVRAFALDLRGKRPEALKKALKKVAPKYRGVRLALFGIPNVGKSQLLNGLVGKKSAPVGGIPGLTRGVSWYQGDGFLVVDSPGILDPKAGAMTERVLAWLGCSKVEVIGGYASLGCGLVDFLRDQGLWSLVQNKWGVSDEGSAQEVLERLGKRLGCLVGGGAVDLDQTGRRLIDGFIVGQFGPCSLESPDQPLIFGEES